MRYSIKELPSERFYEWLNSYFLFIPRYSSDCNTLSAPYKDNHEIKRLCAKVVKYITSKPSILNEEHLKDHHCNLFNYWIYEQLVSGYDNNSIEPALVFGDFLLALSMLKYYPNNNICKLDCSIATIKDRKERKELYEYCIDYKTILNKSQIGTDKCNKYCTYVKNKIQFYEKYQEFCSSEDKSKCPDFFDKICHKCDPSVLLSKLKCDDIEGKEKQQLKGEPSIQSVSNFGNVFLGVVLTSMTSGALYKVNTHLIKINQ
ncbi:hypothetical protein PVNG_04725 [Plasmodium vivax North Korean]|uniref:Uncharacterized protein n=1 Tax=Plasmodium vivax North Korean TaxID=1035514 RepID=A0A0J9WF31_PLAVI|nr:hypothetical protein PVNG_04725 [Plasmodium vivax North Korean]